MNEILVPALAIQAIVGGGLGIFAYRYIIWVQPTFATIDSQSLVARCVWRYLIFSFGYLGSFLFLTPLILWPLTYLPGADRLLASVRANHLGGLYAFLVVPMALVVYRYCCRSIRRATS